MRKHDIALCKDHQGSRLEAPWRVVDIAWSWPFLTLGSTHPGVEIFVNFYNINDG